MFRADSAEEGVHGPCDLGLPGHLVVCGAMTACTSVHEGARRIGHTNARILRGYVGPMEAGGTQNLLLSFAYGFIKP